MFLRFLKTKYIFYYRKNLKHCKNMLRKILKRNLLILTIFFCFVYFFRRKIKRTIKIIY